MCGMGGRNGGAKTTDLWRWRVAGMGGEMVRDETLERCAQTFAVTGFSPKAFLRSYGLDESTRAVTFAPLDRGVEVDRIDQDHYSHTGNVEPILRRANGKANGKKRAARSYVICRGAMPGHEEIGRASWRGSGCQYV